MIPKALQFRDRTLRLLDQRRLPAEEVWLHCRDADSVAVAIRELAVRGAPAIGVAAAYGMALAARLGSRAELLRAAEILRDARPTAVNLAWAVDRMLRAADTDLPADQQSVAERLLAEALAIHEEDAAACRKIGEHGQRLIPKGARVLTHCNAGALATGGIGTALAPIYVAAENGRAPKVFACEARPVMQGARLTTWELARAGVDVALLVDAAAAFLISRREVDLVIVGADRIAANGDVANKVGTYGLACAAAESDVPFYVAAPSTTYDPNTPTGADIPIEFREPEELAARFSEPVSASGIKSWTPAFDVTPAHFVSAYITEKGVQNGVRRQSA